MALPLSDIDRDFLHRAVRLAMNGRGKVEPNPMVGCILVKNGRVIGQGFHERFGGPHAEPNALASCTEDAANATAYVTLEPCCHTNKKTPPCVPKLIEAGIKRAVVGCTDPNCLVSGQGIDKLRMAGIQVDEPVDPECRQLIAPYAARVIHNLPYVTLKWAQTADGKVAGPGGKRVQISNKRSQRLIHDMRSRSDAIMVGIGTAIADDPLLTTRGVEGSRPLIRIVLDSDLRLPIDSQLVRTIDRGRVVVFCSKEASYQSGARVALAACGVEIRPVSLDVPGRLRLWPILHEISAMGVTHLIVEPGPTLARTFMDDALWDRAWIIQSKKSMNDSTAPSASPISNTAVASVDLEGDLLTEYTNPGDEADGKIFPSVDLVLLQE